LNKRTEHIGEPILTRNIS